MAPVASDLPSRGTTTLDLEWLPAKPDNIANALERSQLPQVAALHRAVADETS
jgi:hypothetical protein